MAEIATIFISPFLQVFFERMASGDFVDFFRRRKLSDVLVKKLETSFLTVVAVLEVAEEMQVTQSGVKKWLDEVKDAVYDAEHVLDEIATEALRSELDAQFQTTASKVRKLSISAFHNSFFKEIEPKIKEVVERLDDLARQKDLLRLPEGIGRKSSEISSTTSLVEESDIYGRNDEKEEIIKMLLSDDDASNNEMCVIAIVGMGGIGKTTLAQIVYNHDKVNEQFNLKAWVCVSEEFNVFKVTKTILEAVTLSPCSITDLNQLQLKLKDCLMGKKFLLVLDDVWNEKYAEWEDLCKPFKFGALGSKVLVTTRNDSVALVMRATTMSHHLKGLPEEDCWSLFAKRAFHVGNSNAHGEFEVVGRKIMEKCGGLPLAIKAIGALLRSKLDVDEWNKILNNELWDLPIDEMGILPALRLSYKYLPSHIKQCFAYCSIFPKDYAFKKDQLILLWMAEGFLRQPRNKTMEEVGNEYFLTLESRSLFQKSSDDKSCFVMHDLVSDLAKSISGQFISRLENGCSHEIVKNTRHLSYFFKQKFHSLKKFKTLHKAKRFRTFLHLNTSSYNFPFYHLSKKVLHDLLPTLRCLRLLSLSQYENITKLPESIGKLKHLRYLDLSFTQVLRLPDSICELCNLQTLRLSHCRELVVLPRDMWKLINLRHLDITKTGIKETPIHLGRLKYLQTLTKFFVGKGSGTSIGELGNFTNLQGSLSILELQNVESPSDALNASLRNKKYLEELVLEWNADTKFSESQRSVLDNLQPHTSLKSLTIRYYGGKSFSDWVGHPSFSNVASLELEDCTYCSKLPPLGQLHSLQKLCVVGFSEVVTVGHEFFGSGSSSSKPFGALKFLKFENMLKWGEWNYFGDEYEGVGFPKLEELYIMSCPKLTGGLPVQLPSLAIFHIDDCQQLVAPLPSRTPALRDLRLDNCNGILLNEWPPGMQELVIGSFDALEFLPKGMIDSNGGLQELRIRSCSSLVSLPKEGLPSTLKSLDIMDCKKLELPTNFDYSSLEKLSLWDCDSVKSIPLDLFPNLFRIEIWKCSNLESLTVPENYEHDLVTLEIEIRYCHNFVSFPKGGLRAPKLTRFLVDGCGSLRSLPDKMHMLLPSLDFFLIVDCPKVESFPEGGLPSNLKAISIPFHMGCGLQNLPFLTDIGIFGNHMGWGLQNLPFLTDIGIFGNHIIIRSESEVVESFPEEQLLPTSLTSLEIWSFPNLKSLDKKGLQHLNALKRLSIWNCPKLKYMPEQGLPPSLSILEISDCPLLKKKLQSKKGKEWCKIAHVEEIQIDYKFIE